MLSMGGWLAHVVVHVHVDADALAPSRLRRVYQPWQAVQPGEEIRALPNCKHAFHSGDRCIDRWLQSHASCPICKRAALPVAAAGGARAVEAAAAAAAEEEGRGGQVWTAVALGGFGRSEV